MKRLGFVGTLVWDTVRHPAGPGAVQQWGGAVYSLCGLSACCPPGWEVVPIVKVGSDLAERAAARLAELPNLDLGPGLRVVPEPNNRVELLYDDSAERREVQSGGVPGWTWEDLRPLVGSVDALYLNFISGFELDVETALRLRASFRGPIYTDIHSLFLTPPGEQPRQRRPLPRAPEWLSCFDAIQLNETELELLAEGEPDVEGFAREIPASGPGLVLVTLGPRGARFVARDGLADDPLRWSGPAPTIPRELFGVRSELVGPPAGSLGGDPTGCGDVWGSVMFTGLLGGLSLPRSAERANRLAAVKIRHPATAELHLRLREALREGEAAP